MKPERRHQPRMKLNNLSCIQIEPDNGGVVLNLSEDGLSFQAVAPIQVGSMHFWLLCPPSGRIEATGHLSWTDGTNRVGGLRFVDPSEDVRRLVSDWLTKSTPEPDAFRETNYLADPILHEGPFSLLQRDLVRNIVIGIVILLLAIVGIFKLKTDRHQVSDLPVQSGRELGLKSEPQPLPVGSMAASTSSSPTSDASSADHSSTEGASITTADKPAPKIGQPSSQTLNTVEGGQSELTLAQEYLNGTNVKQNSQAAAQWLWAAVRKGNTTAEIALADLYLTGDGVTKNCEQARILLLAAAKKGNAPAKQKLQIILGHGCS